ncbi:DegV family protein [Streptococcus pseudoporcinus]|uniref:DegV family protein n=1 Tax=Streptococcus pseudoporcinus TaxID=361101 RepID=A0A4U9XND3_9STRE|nr:DegV family protein [Streptococcus pseudoporcinus]VTS13921.1 DegV family protein [Streptococcus pseudoporcinus]VUC66881.1 DegV family protein [Streptococcus pseudoporcinus]VUC97809.1 DegV family protein [Streptococcus pseudoporcinus]VUC98201.1 DegV family protein [Streptococcus pseudoporcinus]
MKLAIVTDNTTAIPEEVKNHKDIYVLNIPVIFDNEPYYEGLNLSLDEFYQKMANSSELPKTSQPSLTELDELLTDLSVTGYTHVIGLFLAGGISGFWQNIQFLVEEHPDLTVAFPDSKIASVPTGNMISAILDWCQKGDDFDIILKKLHAKIEGTSAYILVDDLNHLVKGGRLSNGSALLGSLLSIKPILRFNEEGKIVVFEKIRTEKKAMKRLVELLNETAKEGEFEFSIINANGQEKAKALKDMLIESGLSDNFYEANFSSVVGAHLGTNAVAVGYSPIIK